LFHSAGTFFSSFCSASSSRLKIFLLYLQKKTGSLLVNGENFIANVQAIY
jgi:hypothetical protein